MLVRVQYLTVQLASGGWIGNNNGHRMHHLCARSLCEEDNASGPTPVKDCMTLRRVMPRFDPIT